MSHFTVCVRVSEAVLLQHCDIKSAVAALLAPYQENNMGDCPEGFLAFKDMEDEYRKDYETGSTKMVPLADGSHVYPWDERFRVKGTFGTGGGTHKVPESMREVEVFHRDRFATFEAFVADYHGDSARDEKKGRFGYWENPNAKWDWYQIGGRWNGFFPVRDAGAVRLGERSLLMEGKAAEGRSDIVRVSDIDFDEVARLANERAEKFWGEWQRFLGGEKFGGFDGPRSHAMAIGLLEVKQEALTDDEKTRAISWKGFVQPGDDREGWHDVYKVVSREDFFRDYLPTFNPIKAYATLDDKGWNAPGEMGWFGMSSDSPNQYLEFASKYAQWLRDSAADDVLVVVDCHI
jgi:hypothetical protein